MSGRGNPCSYNVVSVSSFDPFSTPELVEQLGRAISMVNSNQMASLERDRALALLEESQRLQHEHRLVVTQPEYLLNRLHHPSGHH